MKKWIFAGFIVTLAVLISMPLFAAVKQEINKIHAESGLTCEECHGSANPTAAPKNVQVCIDCHTDMMDADANKLTEKGHTVEYWIHDPHETPEDKCIACHKQHQPTKFWCNSCHTFVINVP